ncbi:MAG: acetylxylan esterase [Bryobacteraceae bacterium]
MVGYDDTIQVPHEWGGPHGFGDLREELWSFNTLGLQLWDSMRAIDFLQSLPEVDPERIGVTGASGGGTQTFLISAVDPRVKVAAPVNMISAHMQGGTCESADGLRLGTFNVEIGALMAPRPLLLVSATGDWTKNTPKEEFPAIQSIYRLYGEPELVQSIQITSLHNYNQESREAVYRFFGKYLLAENDPAKFVEKKFRVENLQDSMALHHRKLPEGALTYEQFVEQWIAAAKQQNETSKPDAMRERLVYALGADWPSQVLTKVDGQHILLSEAGRGDRVPGIWIRGKGPTTLLLDPKGSEAARNSPEARELIHSGGSVLMIDAYQTGSATAARAQWDVLTGPARESSHELDKEFLVFNKGDAANRVQDILTALAFLSNSGASSITLIGRGDAAIWSVFAAAVANAHVKLKVDLGSFRGDDQDFIKCFFVPGIQRAGGLQAALRLANFPTGNLTASQVH